MDAHNAVGVASLCVRLEGIPLAIELAAARIGAFTPAQMLEQMDDRFTLLTDRRRGISPRHRTLRAAIGWSYETLTPVLKQVFTSLCVFRGGWTAESAREVVGEKASTEALERLRECSLIQSEETGENLRFRMLETLREYGCEKLSSEEKEGLSGRLSDFLVTTAEAVCERYRLTGQAIWLARLEKDGDNFRAALDWLEADRSRAPSLRRLLHAMPYLYLLLGHWNEYRSRLEAAVALLDDFPETYAEIVAWMGQAALRQADFERAEEMLEHSLEMHRAINAPADIVNALVQLAEAALVTDRYAQARILCQEAQAIGVRGRHRGW